LIIASWAVVVLGLDVEALAVEAAIIVHAGLSLPTARVDPQIALVDVGARTAGPGPAAVTDAVEAPITVNTASTRVTTVTVCSYGALVDIYASIADHHITEVASAVEEARTVGAPCVDVADIPTLALVYVDALLEYPAGLHVVPWRVARVARTRERAGGVNAVREARAAVAGRCLLRASLVGIIGETKLVGRALVDIAAPTDGVLEPAVTTHAVVRARFVDAVAAQFTGPPGRLASVVGGATLINIDADALVVLAEAHHAWTLEATVRVVADCVLHIAARVRHHRALVDVGTLQPVAIEPAVTGACEATSIVGASC
jgi:hypothetical protein